MGLEFGQGVPASFSDDAGGQPVDITWFGLLVTPFLDKGNLLRSPWTETFRRLVSRADEDLLLASPFVKRWGGMQVLSELQRRGVEGDVHVTIVTNLRPESALNGSMDLEGLLDLGEGVSRFNLVHLPSLHAKVYVADRKMAAVTSANLTDSGLRGNLEYGVVFTDKTVVEEIRRDFEQYSLLGTKVSLAEVGELLHEIRDLKALFSAAERTIRARARRAIKAKLEQTQLRLLQHRARGNTTQGILCDTIVFLLAKGPLRTVELHPLIQRLQPDVCDDSIDRVIAGVHFGKRWKHHVRSAQQFLKRQERIWFDGERWYLVANQ